MKGLGGRGEGPVRAASGSLVVRRRKPDREAGAGWGVVAVVHVNLPVVAFQQSPGRSQGRGLSGGRNFRPAGLTEWKRLKIASRASGRNAGAFVVDLDPHLIAHMRRGDLDQAYRAGRSSRHCR